MKTLKIRAVIVPCLVMIIAMIGISTPGFAGTPVSSATTDKIQQDNSIIREDLESISYFKSQLKGLYAKYREDKAAGHEEALIIDKRDISKAKANLDRYKEYLAIDKRVLVKDHNLAISKRKNEIKKDNKNLTQYRDKLDKDIALGNEAAIIADAAKVIQLQNKLKNDHARLHAEREYRYNDLVAVNKEIQKVNGKFIVLAYSETAYLNASNLFNK